MTPANRRKPNERDQDVGIGPIAAGVLALVYGGFNYTKETHETKLGPIE